VLRPFVAGYVVAARGLTLLLKGPMTMKELTKKTLVLGDRMFLSGDISRREGVSRPILENAFEALRDQQYVALSEGKLALTPSFASSETAATVEARLRAYIGEDRA